MVIKNRLFPYPVLCGETDDYRDTTDFLIVPEITENEHELIFQYDFIVKCNSLERLIREGKAQYVLHIECSTTAFRIALKSSVPHIEYRLAKAYVSGEVNMIAMLVTLLDVKNYTSDDLNEDYSGILLSFPKGSILAYQNLPELYIPKKIEDIAANDSLFTVTKQTGTDPNEILPVRFNLFDNKIQIIVDQKTYEAFIRYQHIGTLAMSLLVLPAVIYMIEETSKTPEIFRKYDWFQRFEKFYISQGKDFVEDVINKDENCVMIAQEMFQSPISRAYRELYTLEG